MYSFFQLYLVKGNRWDLLDRILWLLIPFLFWFPLALLAGLLVVVFVRKDRGLLLHCYYVPLSIVLFVSAVLLGPLAGGAGLYRLFGWSRGVILGGFFGLVTGGWVGLVVAKQLNRSSERARKPFGTIFLVVAAVLMLFAYYLPLALFEYSLGGGSGYGEGLPRVVSRLFEYRIARWFRYVHGAIWILSCYQIQSVIFWVLAICCLLYVGHRFLKTDQFRDRRTLIKPAAAGLLLIAATMVLFFSVDEGKPRPHIATICPSLTTISGIKLSVATKASMNETYPAAFLAREQETMSKHFEQWTPTPVRDDPSFRVTSIAPDGATEIELVTSGTKLKSKPGRPFACREYGPEGLWLTDASFEQQAAQFTRYICKD